MIKNISAIKKCGIFQNFEWKAIPDFKRFNLIYGWNRSGKTTISRIIYSIHSKISPFTDPEAYFELVTAAGTVKSNDFSYALSSVRVFNTDFIRDNVRFDDLRTEPIVYVSEEDIKLKTDLDALAKEVGALEIKTAEYKKTYDEAKKTEEGFRKDVAVIIKSLVGVHRDDDQYANYDRGDVQRKIEGVGSVEKLKKLSDETLEKVMSVANGVPKKKLTKVTYSINCSVSIDNDGVVSTQLISSFISLKETLLNALAKRVEMQSKERFVTDAVLRDWVERGLDLHNKKHEEKHCLFCEQSLPKDFLNELSSYFNPEYRELKTELLAIQDAFKNIQITADSPTSEDFYEDIKDDATIARKEVERAIKDAMKYIRDLTKHVKNKLKDTGAVFAPIAWRDDLETNLNEAITKLNDLIGQHNARVDNASEEKTQAKSDIEEHHIADFADQKDYKTMLQNIASADQELKQAQAAFVEKKEALEELRKKTSTIGTAVDRINAYLREFLGNHEIVLKISNDKKGYQIIRHGKPANNLCEGEKTSIAFAHFMTKLGEDGFDLKSGAVIIDDPVSSLDSMRIHHCFAVIKRELEHCAQVFVLTHNFEFFDLIKQWLKKREENRVRKHKDIDCAYYMIKTNMDAVGNRTAAVEELDEALKKFDSEYQYLFSELNRFANGEPSQGDMYVIGNMARRFLEAYLRFKLPNEGDVASKLDSLKVPEHIVSRPQKTQIYQLVNQRSHAEPFQLSYHADLEECRSAVKALLDVIKHSDEKHFEALMP